MGVWSGVLLILIIDLEFIQGPRVDHCQRGIQVRKDPRQVSSQKTVRNQSV